MRLLAWLALLVCGGSLLLPAAALAEDPPPYAWPVDAATVVRRFQPPPQPWLPGHRGVDLMVDAAGSDPLVRSAGSGVVVFAGLVAGRPVISIEHTDGLRTTYEPVIATVTAGQPVVGGEPIGTLQPGHAACPVRAPEQVCLHWGLRRFEMYLDPLSLMRLGQVRLLPLDGRI